MSGGLPHLMDFADEHTRDAERFAILAFHDPRAKTLAELDEKLAPIERDRWGGRKLPFPILLDSGGETVRTWGVSAYPTTVLIDPSGAIVESGSGTKRGREICERLARELERTRK